MIRDLKLNIKPSSKCHRNKQRLLPRQSGVNWANLITIKKHQQHDPDIIIATVNIQSIRTKELQVSELIKDHAKDALVVTDTWLSNKDKTWCGSMDLNRHGYNLYYRNRAKGKGGGLALICKTAIKVPTVHKGDTRSFEFVTWRLTAKSRQLTLTASTTHHTATKIKQQIVCS